MAIKNNQLENAARSLLASTAPSTVPNSGAFYTKDVAGSVEAFYLDNSGNEVQITNSGVVNVTGLLGEINTASNQGAGEGTIFKQKTGVDLEFKTIKAGTNISIDNSDPDFILVSGPANAGEANTASNVGAGNELFKQKTLVDLEFRTLIAGTGIAMVAGVDELTISATGSGSGSALSVQEEGVTIDTDVTNMNFIGSAITATQSAPGNIDITVTGGGETNTSSNLGLGVGIAATKSGVDLPFKSLIGGTNVTVTSDATSVTINSSASGGSALTAKDEGVSLDAAVTEFDFTGTGVTATQTASGIIQVNVPGSAGSGVPLEVKDEGASLDTDVAGINFTGTGVTATQSAAGQITVDIPNAGGATNLNGLTDVTVSAPANTEVLTYNGASWVNSAAPSGGSGDLLSTNNLSDVANAATALANLGGQADLAVPSQAEAEAGTSTAERVWTAERVNQAIQALAPAGGGSSNEFVIIYPAGASTAARAASATVPTNWTLDTASNVTEPQFGSETTDLVIAWDVALGAKYAEISFYQVNAAASTFSGGRRLKASTHSNPSNIYANSAGTLGFVDINGVGVDNTLDAIIVVKLY